MRHGISDGETADRGCRCAKDPVQSRDLHATLLKLFGSDAKRFSHPPPRPQGLEPKLIGVKPAKIIKDILAERFPPATPS